MGLLRQVVGTSFWESTRDFLADRPLWHKVVAGLIVVGVAGLLKWMFGRKGAQGPVNVSQDAANSSSQVSLVGGSGHHVQVESGAKTDGPSTGPIYVTAQRGSSVVITVNVYDYQDGVAESPKPNVRNHYAEGRKAYARGEYDRAIESFLKALETETDPDKRSALLIQSGNAAISLRKHSTALDYYSEALREAEKAGGEEGIASAFGSLANAHLEMPASSPEEHGRHVREARELYRKALAIFEKQRFPIHYATTQNNLGNAYSDLPASTPEERGENVRKAIECYRAALDIYKRDQHPLDFAMTQNNLGTAYSDLPASTPEERAENVRKAIECYRAALDIYKRDQHPQDFCLTAANLGKVLADTGDPQACMWLKEAYSLRQFLADQGRGIERIIKKVCGEA